MTLLLLATMALASPDSEYWTDRPDALGAYMRCASKAFDQDSSIGRSEAMDRIKRLVPVWKKEYFEGGEVWVEGAWDESATRL